MTAAQVAQHFNAKKTGRGKWMALCPAHPDRNRSLSIAEGKKGVLLKCMSAGCDTRDVVKAAGLTMQSLFYDAEAKFDKSRMCMMAIERRAEEHWQKAEWTRKRVDRLNTLALRGYSKEDAAKDFEAAIAIAELLTNKETPHLQLLLKVLMDNVVSFESGVL